MEGGGGEGEGVGVGLTGDLGHFVYPLYGSCTDWDGGGVLEDKGQWQGHPIGGVDGKESSLLDTVGEE